MLQEDARWGGLAQDILEVIIRKFKETSGLSACLALQLVSKSWRAAVRNAPLKVEVHIDKIIQGTQSPEAIAGICGLLPGLSDLSIYSYGTELDVSPVSVLSRLTNLVLYKVADYRY